MSTTVYILELPKGLYVGVTHNIVKRLRAHEKRTCVESKKLGAKKGKVKLVHSWEAPNRLWALKFEKYLHGIQKQYTSSKLFEIINDVPFWNKLFEEVNDCMKITLTPQDLKYLEV
jgi:predicted GIY-YIG superfamily endonuclease